MWVCVCLSACVRVCSCVCLSVHVCACVCVRVLTWNGSDEALKEGAGVVRVARARHEGQKRIGVRWRPWHNSVGTA